MYENHHIPPCTCTMLFIHHCGFLDCFHLVGLYESFYNERSYINFYMELHCHFSWISVTGTDVSCGKTFLKKCRIVFQSSYSIFHSHQQGLRSLTLSFLISIAPVGFDCNCFGRVKYLTMVFACYSTMTVGVGYLLISFT